MAARRPRWAATAVPQRLDPGGQSLQATGDPSRGGGLECRTQCPADGTSDGRTDRPVGDQPDDDGADQGGRTAAWRLAGSMRLVIASLCRTGRALDQMPETISARPTPIAGAEEDDDRSHRPNTESGRFVAEVGKPFAQPRRHAEVVDGRSSTVGLGEDLGRDDVGAVGVLHHTDRGHIAPGQTRGVGTFAHEDHQVERLGGELGRCVVGQVLGGLGGVGLDLAEGALGRIGVDGAHRAGLARRHGVEHGHDLVAQYLADDDPVGVVAVGPLHQVVHGDRPLAFGVGLAGLPGHTVGMAMGQLVQAELVGQLDGDDAVGWVRLGGQGSQAAWSCRHRCRPRRSC